ncbi:CaiB/BaiF CoA-transferase family protein [Sphingopyxis sp. GW247-27LB]|uniref:CaiB/BaiF CoA transferase family protein n=1 Tax=Sphingopyxis sp. GW247-27LB TaxID=2012632 RepID=UPI000BA5F5B7|nr:CoA transferase [Sphingopyxis sp. GW247-27LB]PAL24316.1 carnitine dehydratase [Sphingopyxis sp. GW247-27LB]
MRAISFDAEVDKTSFIYWFDHSTLTSFSIWYDHVKHGLRRGKGLRRDRQGREKIAFDLGDCCVSQLELPAYHPRPAQAEVALEDIRVVDFTHFVAGPFCTMMLGDLGADVIKVENAARGDDMRMAQPPEIGGEGGPFLWANRNKRSIGLDLANEGGRDVARQLIAQADIVVENFSAGVMEKFGLDYASVAPDNPGLIYCSISAYGRDGPLAKRTGFDPIAQAESGLMSINGAPDGPAMAIGTPLIDITSGMMAGNAVLAALFARSRTGRGQLVEVAMYDQAITMLAYQATNYLISGSNPSRSGNFSRTTAPVGVFSTRDGDIFVCCANERTYQRLAIDVLERPDLVEDIRFATNASRAANYDVIMPLIADIFASETRATWLQKMRATGVPGAPVATVAEAMTSAEIRERGLVSQIPHPVAGMVPNIAPPFRLNGTPVADPRAAPTLGQHNHEVLEQVLGLDSRAIESVIASGALGRKTN